jgi:hypothetical protein
MRYLPERAFGTVLGLIAGVGLGWGYASPGKELVKLLLAAGWVLIYGVAHWYLGNAVNHRVEERHILLPLALGMIIGATLWP